MNRCYECVHWRKHLGTEKWGKCTLGGPGTEYFNDRGKWPVTEKDEGCGQWSDGDGEGKHYVMKLDDIVRAFKK